MIDGAYQGETGRVRCGIFVNYRVGDCEREAALLARLLADRFGDDRVFFASRSIPPGDDFAEAIPDGLARCSVLLAVIGSNWFTVTDNAGRVRIYLDDDWVRREIRIALTSGLRVIPILVDGQEKLPKLDKARLPPDIPDLADKQYVRSHYQNINLDLLVSRLAETNPELFSRKLLTSAGLTAKLAGQLRDYLLGLRQVLSRTPRWLPYRRLDSAFAERSVRVSDDLPTLVPDAGLYQPILRSGVVRWDRAIDGVPIAVVLADAGYGKTWQLRRHCIDMCDKASVALELGIPLTEIPLPLWCPAADIARCWGQADSPAASVVAAAFGELSRSGTVVASELPELLAGLFTDGNVHVLIDAYDEIFDDIRRSSVKQALRWLTDAAQLRAARIILTSRPAGYDQPFDLRDDPDDNLPEAERPRYLHLGVLEKYQVHALWTGWYNERRMPVPDNRLEPAVAPNSPLRRFVGIPLVAAFCAWVAEEETVSAARAGLYGQVLRRFIAQAWKTDPATAGSARQDGGRRALIEDSLTGLAWHMATSDGRWRDAVDISECERVLMAARPPASTGHSRTWELVREIGILVQESGEEHSLGDGQVLWIHRSVQQYLAARKLVSLGTLAAPVIEAAWLHPAWGDVLDFAIGLEAGASTEGAVTSTTRARVTGDDDGLGWYASTFAAASAGLPAAPAVRGAVVDRIWRLHSVGLLSATHLANVLALMPETDPEAVAKALWSRLQVMETDRAELWEALAWAGTPGRSMLAGLIRRSRDASGAAAALHVVDPDAAVTAIRDRVAEDLPLDAADGAVLRQLDERAVALLAERYEADPESEERAGWLALTKHPLALDVLSDPARIRDADAQIRYAAASGLAEFYGADIDRAGLETLLDRALADPLPELRRRIRNRLEAIAEDVPWVEDALAEVAAELHRDSQQPEITNLESLAASLREIGPATHKAVTMLVVEPGLIEGPVREALFGLMLKALEGTLDEWLTADLARAVAVKFGAKTFADPATEVLRQPEGAPLAAGRLAVGLARAAPGDQAVYETLADCAANHPHPLTSAVLYDYELPRAMKCDVLCHAILRLSSARPRAAEIWSRVLRNLLQEAPQHERQELRGICAAATQHLLSLPKQAQ